MKTRKQLLIESLLLEDAKDDMRINDIIAKSGGNSWKQADLAKDMATKITTPEKAYQRYLAANKILGPDHQVTLIFANRAKKLGQPVHDHALTSSSYKQAEVVRQNKTAAKMPFANQIIKAIKAKTGVSCSIENPPIWRSNMYGSDGDFVITMHLGNPSDGDLRGYRGNVTNFKPSVLGKVGTQIRDICKRYKVSLNTSADCWWIGIKA